MTAPECVMSDEISPRNSGTCITVLIPAIIRKYMGDLGITIMRDVWKAHTLLVKEGSVGGVLTFSPGNKESMSR